MLKSLSLIIGSGVPTVIGIYAVVNLNHVINICSRICDGGR